MKKKFFTVDKFGKVSAFGFGFVGFVSLKKYLNCGFNAGSRVLKVYKGLAGACDSDVLTVVLADNVDLMGLFHLLKKNFYSSTVDVQVYAPFERGGRKMIDTFTIF